jgi:tetratricopeptide (TPR) repeat protein
MLIAQLEPPHATRGGDWFYRTYSPGCAMARHDQTFVADATNIHRCRDALFRAADVLILNMVCDPDLLPVIAARRARGQITVYEVNDDVAYMQPWNPAAAFYADPNHQALFRCLIRSCEAAQFSTTELERVYGGLSQERAIFPNQISREPARRPRAADGAPVVIGWGGSVGHLEDLAKIAPVLIDWLTTRNDAVLHLMCSDRIFGLFDRLANDKKRRFLPGAMQEYESFVSGLDIGLGPLQDTGFNRCRSDVKFLEYASSAVTPVMKRLAPYQETMKDGVTGFLYTEAAELISILDSLIGDRAKRTTVAEQALAYVRSERRESTHAGRRIEWYRALSSGRAPASAQGSRTARQAFESVARLSASKPDGRHVTVENGLYEGLVLRALARGQLDGEKREALTYLERAQELEPSAYQPYLFGAEMSPDPTGWLFTSLRKNPQSIGARTALAQHLAGAGDMKSALEMLLAATELCPSYDVPYLSAARILENAGHQNEAREFAHIALSLRRPLIELYAGQ